LTILLFSALLFLFSILAGLIGALTGLGGGVVVIPVMVLIFHIDMRYAMGASLICVMANSSGAAAAYLKEGYTNLRIGLFLETAAVIGAFTGALLAAHVSKVFLSAIFSFVLFLSAFLTLRRKESEEFYEESHPWSLHLKLDSSYPLEKKKQHYRVQNVPFAYGIMIIAGMISGLLGIGSGTLKVLAMDQGMRLPYKVATTTSNFMIGITAAVSAGIYFAHGYIQPALTFPVMIGVLAGAFIGAKLLKQLHHRTLRIFFSIILCFIGLEMLYQALTEVY
jgi:uncharacterized protein